MLDDYWEQELAEMRLLVKPLIALMCQEDLRWPSAVRMEAYGRLAQIDVECEP